MQTLQQGSKIGEYSVEALVSSGAAGALYRATQPNLNRTVAVQVASAPAESEQGERFLNAARRLAAIDHPNLLPVYEVGVDEARPFAVMRDVRGQPLDELLRAAPLAAKPAVAVADGVAGALDALRSSGVAVARLDAASVVVAPDHVYFAPLIAGTELRRLEDAGPDPSVPALAALVDSMVDATGNDRLARVIHTGRQGGYPSAASLVEAARNAVAPAPRRRRRGALLLAAAGLAAALVLAVALVTADDEERPQEVNRPLATAPAGRIAARIALNADPGSAAVGEGAVWVATQEGNVLRVDPRRNEVTGAPIRFMRA